MARKKTPEATVLPTPAPGDDVIRLTDKNKLIARPIIEEPYATTYGFVIHERNPGSDATLCGIAAGQTDVVAAIDHPARCGACLEARRASRHGDPRPGPVLVRKSA